MSDSERLVRFKLFGQDYAFYTGASEEEMEEILDFVKTMIEESAPGLPGTLPVGKVAIMACLNLASRFMKLNQDFENYKSEIEDRVSTINRKVEEVLAQEKQMEV